MIHQNLNQIFETAFNKFLDKERKNIFRNISERNLCGRLAIYLNEAKNLRELDDYYCDVEYNRKQDDRVKTIIDDEMKIISITCDLILHSRGERISDDNLIAIEMKKSNRPAKEKQDDRNRLRAMTKISFDSIWSNDGNVHPEHVCGYQLGYFIELDALNRRFLIETYVRGELSSSDRGTI